MIPNTAIIEWQNIAPWPDSESVEQDLIISRAIVEIFRDDFLRTNLAFRGGTALHKLFLAPASRYSEDIDLVQTTEGPAGIIFDHLRAALSFMGDPRTKRKTVSNKMIFRTESTIPPVRPIRLKVEVNSKECFSEFGYIEKSFEVSNTWFNDSCSVTTYTIEELLGTKLRALYQRKKGRDLFDLWIALSTGSIDSEQVVQAYQRYIMFSGKVPPTKSEFANNLDLKMTDRDFLDDITDLLRPGILYKPTEAHSIVQERLINRIGVDGVRLDSLNSWRLSSANA
jgi:predicted nucleotidyltransferase component of viral defense system